MARLEELKRQNIEKFIHSVRQDLVTWWDRCYVSDTERQGFTPFHAEIYTEELLQLHEAQVEKYEELYTSNKEIFSKVRILIMCQFFPLKFSFNSFLLHRFIIVKTFGRKWKTLKLEAKTQPDFLEIEAAVFFKKKRNGRKS